MLLEMLEILHLDKLLLQLLTVQLLLFMQDDTLNLLQMRQLLSIV